MNSQELKQFGKDLTQLQRPMYLYIVSLVSNPVDASDLLQETNCVIWEKVDEFAPGTNLTAWAYSIARFKVLEWRRAQGRERNLPTPELMERLADRVTAALDDPTPRNTALEHCLDQLRSQDREVILARYSGNVSVEGLGRRLGQSANAMSQSLFRIRKALQKCIEREGRAK